MPGAHLAAELFVPGVHLAAELFVPGAHFHGERIDLALYREEPFFRHVCLRPRRRPYHRLRAADPIAKAVPTSLDDLCLAKMPRLVLNTPFVRLLLIASGAALVRFVGGGRVHSRRRHRELIGPGAARCRVVYPHTHT